METNFKPKYYIVVTPFFPSAESFRGPFIYDQVKSIQKNSDYKVLVYMPKQVGSSNVDYEFDGIQVKFFDSLLVPSNILSGIANSLNANLFYRFIKKEGINVDDIAVIHCHTSTCGCYGLKLKTENPNIRHFIQHHDADPYNIRNGRFAKALWNLWSRASFNKRLFSKVDLHICVSEYTQRNLVDFPTTDDFYDDYIYQTKRLKSLGFKGARDLKTYVLYNGVNSELYFSKNNRKFSDQLIIGAVGNFVELKGQIYLIKAVEQLLSEGLDIILKLVGSGPQKKECIDYVNSHGLSDKIIFVAEMPHEKLCDFYNSLDLFCLPSFFEGFGCVYTEAAACGVPYMICERQGAAEYIPEDERNVWLVKPRKVDDLKAKIKNFYNNRQKQHYIHSFDIDCLTKKFLECANL